MKLIRGCFTFIGVITVLFLISLGLGYCLLSLSPPLKAQMTPVILTAEAAQSLDQKLELFRSKIQNAAAAREEKQISLLVTEEEVNSKLVLAIGEGKLPLIAPMEQKAGGEVPVNFRKDILLIYGALKTPGFSIKVGIKARVEVIDGKPKIIIEEAQFGRLPLPKGIRKNAGDLLLSLFKAPLINLSGITGELPWQVTQVQITDGQMIITGITKKGE